MGPKSNLFRFTKLGLNIKAFIEHYIHCLQAKQSRMGGAFRSCEAECDVTVATRTAHCRNGQVPRGGKHVGFGQTEFAGHLFGSCSAGVPEQRPDDRRTVSTLSDTGMGEKPLVSRQFFFSHLKLQNDNNTIIIKVKPKVNGVKLY